MKGVKMIIGKLENCFHCGKGYANKGGTKTPKEQASTLGFCSVNCLQREEKKAENREETKRLLHNLTDAEIKQYLKGSK
jgi:predicted sulfurtransferase